MVDSDVVTDESDAIAAEWMSAVSALDDLHEHADLQTLAEDLDSLDRQFQPSIPPPMDMASMALAEFLSDMDSRTATDPDQPEKADSLCVSAPQSTDQVPERADALNASQPKPKKKKLSSLERTRRSKALLQQEILHMQKQIKHIRREHCERLTRVHAKRWKPIIQHELDQTEILKAEQLKLKQRIQKEQLRARVALQLVLRMRRSVQASLTTVTHIPFHPQMEPDRDLAIFHALAWSIRVKSQSLDHVLPTHSTENEMSFGKLSSNGVCAEYEFVRFMPFDALMTSRVTWNCAQSDFGSVYTALNKRYADDTRAIMQDFIVPVSSLHNVRMKIRVICKRFVHGQRTVYLWEGLSQWLGPTDRSPISTHEHGAIVIEPLDSVADSVTASSVKGFARLTPIGLGLDQSTNTLSDLVLPAYEKVTNARHQLIENSALDTLKQSSSSASATV